jgi:hypothetical protein
MTIDTGVTAVWCGIRNDIFIHSTFVILAKILLSEKIYRKDATIFMARG